jgi:hypothetical protein
LLGREDRIRYAVKCTGFGQQYGAAHGPASFRVTLTTVHVQHRLRLV